MLSREELLSPVALSNLFTKSVTAKKDKRQKVRKSYSVPDENTRLLLAQLILEETLETIAGLGMKVRAHVPHLYTIKECSIEPMGIKPDLLKIIDGNCDSIYVHTGCMVACGVPDNPHIGAVCDANNAKFPEGIAKIDPETGKYLKPLGWSPPNHELIRKHYKPQIDMHLLTTVAESAIAAGDATNADD